MTHDDRRIARDNKLAEAVFGVKAKPEVPQWKQMQDEERMRRQALLKRQRTARLAHEADTAKTDTGEKA